MMLVALVVVPVVAALGALVVPPARARWINLTASLAVVVLAIELCRHALYDERAPTAVLGMLRADGLGALVALVVAVAAAIGAACASRSFTVDRPDVIRTYTTLAPLLGAALTTAALADNLGVLWIALELSAVIAAFLIGSGGRRADHEAALKYMLLGSVGLVLGLLATAVVHSAAVPALGHTDEALSFHHILEVGGTLDPSTMRIALALAAAGYGLKAGLFPLHVWKPDAYAAAPGPVAALLAGGAVTVALAALVRFGALAAAAGQGAFVSQLFISAGAVSMVAALLLMVRERDLRRVLAFTSVEQLGLVLLAFGLGGEGATAGTLQLIGNGVLKALAFGVLGFVVAERGGGDSQSGAGLYRHSRGLVAVFLIVVAAGLGFPPFLLFTSELFILRSLFATGHHAAGVAVLLSLAAIFGVVAVIALRLLFARSDDARPPAASHGRLAFVIAAPALAALSWLGVAMPHTLWLRLTAAVAAVGL